MKEIDLDFPRATARLQFHKDFTFDDAVPLVDYYAALGVSHLYASPFLTARPGSTHGYDIVDPTRINPELGGEAALRRLAARLREAGMGLIADIVPNHMGTGNDNPWWQNVLEWGRESPYAGWFDIDWESPDPSLHGRMLAPFLGETYGSALASGNLQLRYDGTAGKLFAAYYDNRFPLAPATYADVLRTAGAARLAPVVAAFERAAGLAPGPARIAAMNEAFSLLCEAGSSADGLADIDAALASFSPATPHGAQALHVLLEAQHYRLAWWRNAAEEINWRRFFEVSDLAGVRVERDEVFEATHALIFQLYREGVIDGLRVDHVDGLAHPAEYCRKLRQRMEALATQRPGKLAQSYPYLVIEKILADGEALRSDWQVDGTTGYDFMDQVGAVLHDPAGEAPLTALWEELAGDRTGFEEEVRMARRQLIAQNFTGEFEALCRLLHQIARADVATRDHALPAIRRVMIELLAHFPVYRTYAGEQGRDAADGDVFWLAAARARHSLRSADHGLLEAIGGWLGGTPPASIARADVRDLCLRAIIRFQQLTPPMAAKSVEDTAFYRNGRLLSRNEVGSDPARFALRIDEFHHANAERAAQFPLAMLATATHDHKRGEDLRVRLSVLSEIPDEWAAAVRRWQASNAAHRTQIAPRWSPAQRLDAPGVQGPDPGDELMLYQMLAGAWPVDLDADDREGVAALAKRIEQWQTKSLREAKRKSSWAQADEAYEEACRAFLFAILETGRDNPFLRELTAFVQRIAVAGAVNSLSQTALRLTVPGVPDLYQGTELWDFSLVDPDNRRPVDFAARRRMLAEERPWSDLMADWRDGGVKQRVVGAGLHLRAALPQAFGMEGSYLPLAVDGPQADRVIAFCRRHGGQEAITVVTRLCAGLLGAQAQPVVPHDTWGDTFLVLPEQGGRAWQGLLDAQRFDASGGRLRIDAVLAHAPVAFLVRKAS
jgi:(1->4)-alpha-D-glucan 1-alpha-D-glucosylmutase